MGAGRPPLAAKTSAEERLAAAALDLLAHAGSRGTTTRAVADAARVNEVTLFRLFGSKDHLIVEALQRHAREVPHTPLPRHVRDPERELTRWAREHYRYLRSARLLILTTLAEADRHPAIAEWLRALTPVVTDLREFLARHRRPARAPALDPSAWAIMLVGALFTDAMCRDIEPTAFPPPEQVPDVYVRGLDHAVRRSRRPREKIPDWRRRK